MSNTLLIVILVMLGGITLTGLYFYYILVEAPPKPKEPPKPEVKKPEPTPGKKPLPQKKYFEIPPEIPRTLKTIKLIIEERPEMFVSVIKKWLADSSPGIKKK